MRQREVRLRRDKTGDAMDQASWRSSFLDDPGTKFICGKQGISTKKETSSKKPGGLWKLTPRWKSAKNADFDRGLKKPRQRRSAFSQFPQAQQSSSTQNFNPTFVRK